MSRAIVPVNGSNRDWSRHRYVLWFGACAPTRLMIWADGLESAIEIAGEWLAEHAPGLIIRNDAPLLAELMGEACAELGVDPSQPGGPEYDAAWEQATADLTYTESGYLTSYEWGIDLEDPTRAQVLELQAAIA